MTARQRFLAARVAYVLTVLLATLTRLDLSPDVSAAAERLARAFTPAIAWRDAIDGLRNLALFAGLGAVWVVSSVSGRVAQEIRRATLVGVGLSATVEGFQVFSPERMASLLDVITNTLGTLGGALMVAMLIAGLRRAKGARSYIGVPTALLAGAYASAVLCEALTPLFRSGPLPGLQGGPLARLRVALDLAFPLSVWEVSPIDVALYAPASFLAVLTLAEAGHGAKRAWPAVAGMGAALAVGAEVVHGMFGLSIRWEAAVGHALALVAGAWAAQRWLAPLTQMLRGAARARAAVFAYGVLLILWGWRPLLPQTDPSAIVAQFTLTRFLPLASLAERVDVFSALHVAQQFLLYVPLGALLAVWPLRLTGRWSHLRPAVSLAVGIELGHLVILERFFDVTNALISCAGLGLGWIVVRRSGFAPYGETLAAQRGPSIGKVRD